MRYFNTWFQFTGPKVDIERIKEELTPHCSNIKVTDGVYASFCADITNTDILKEVYKKYPACEYYLSYGISRRYDDFCYDYSKTGSEELLSDVIITNIDGSLDEYTDKKDIILYYGGYRAKDISISLKNGGVVAYHIGDVSYDNFMREPITLATLSNCCNSYVSEAHKKKFAKEFLKDIGALDQIERICFTYEDSRTNMTPAEKSALSEPSLAEFLYCYLSDEIIREYDLTSNTLKQTHEVSIYAPEDPNGGKPDYIFHTIKEEKYEQTIIGVQNEDKAEFSFAVKTEKACVCSSCLSDIEVIEVPAEGLGKAKVTELGKACITDLKNVKKVILPNTLTSFGVGNFTGCKSLKQIVFADAPESKDDLIIQKKTALKGVITLKTSFDVPADITELGKFAFSNCPKLKSVRLQSDIEKMNKDAFAECKTLKTLVLTDAVKTFPAESVKKSKIQEVVLSNGEIVKIYDSVLLDCFVSSENGVTFSYEKAAEKLDAIGAEKKRIQLANELFFEHTEALREKISAVAECLFRYAIGENDVVLVRNIIDKKLSLKVDVLKLVEQANRQNQTEIAAMLLTLRNDEAVEVKNVTRVETLAKRSGVQLYIKVRFENNKSYSYFCDYEVDVGDKVFVPGKMAGQPGEVIDVSMSSPSGRAVAFTLSVEKAFNVKEVSLDDLELDLDLGI